MGGHICYTLSYGIGPQLLMKLSLFHVQTISRHLRFSSRSFFYFSFKINPFSDPIINIFEHRSLSHPPVVRTLESVFVSISLLFITIEKFSITYSSIRSPRSRVLALKARSKIPIVSSEDCLKPRCHFSDHSFLLLRIGLCGTWRHSKLFWSSAQWCPPICIRSKMEVSVQCFSEYFVTSNSIFSYTIGSTYLQLTLWFVKLNCKGGLDTFRPSRSLRLCSQKWK